MSMNINNYSQFYKGAEQLKKYGSGQNGKDTLVRYEFNTTDAQGNKVMDKMSREETLQAMKEISAQYGDNVIVEFSGDGMAKLLDSQKKEYLGRPLSEEETAQRIERQAAFENEIVHYDKKANHLPTYSGIFDVDKTIATAVENCSKEEQAFVYDIIRNNFLIANSSSMTEEERQANISLGMKKAEYAANDFIDADHRKAFLDAMETVAKLASAGKADGHGNMDYGVNKANYLGSGANMVQTTDPLDVMQKSDSKAYEEYQRLRSAGNDAESGANAFKYLVKWYSKAVSNNNKLIENYEKKSQEYVEEKVKNQTIDKTFADVKTENAHQFVQSLMNFKNNRPNFLTSVLQRELALFAKR